MPTETTPEPTLMDAISASIDELNPKEPVVETPETVETPEPEGDEGEVTPPEGETPEQKVEREAAAAAAAETLEQKTAREAAETPEQKAAREAAAVKPADHVNDPIPATVSQRTRERITGLVGLVKERDQTIAENTQLFQQIADTGVSPENFAQTLTMLRMFNSEKIDDKRQALTFLQTQVAHLAKVCGEVVPGTDPLEGHDDLQQHVNAGTITQEHATELAAARNRVKAAEAAQAGTAQAQQAQTAGVEAARTTARTALNALGSALKDLDPEYAKKAPLVIAKLQPLFATLHPSKWVDAFKTEYAAMKAPAPVAAVVPITQKPAGQPLRPNKQPAGGGQAQPKNMQEAIEASLSAMK
jgi:hypothetical protein